MTDDWAKAVHAAMFATARYRSSHLAWGSIDRYSSLVGSNMSNDQILDQMVAEGDSFLIQLISEMVADKLKGKT